MSSTFIRFDLVAKLAPVYAAQQVIQYHNIRLMLCDSRQDVVNFCYGMYIKTFIGQCFLHHIEHVVIIINDKHTLNVSTNHKLRDFYTKLQKKKSFTVY